MEYVVVKWLHILSSTFLFGTGIGSAWYMLFANISRDVRAIAVVSRNVVVADWLFTATTAVIQPATGFYMIHLAGYPFHSTWIMWSVALYVVAGACWLPAMSCMPGTAPAPRPRHGRPGTAAPGPPPRARLRRMPIW